MSSLEHPPYQLQWDWSEPQILWRTHLIAPDPIAVSPFDKLFNVAVAIAIYIPVDRSPSLLINIPIPGFGHQSPNQHPSYRASHLRSGYLPPSDPWQAGFYFITSNSFEENHPGCCCCCWPCPSIRLAIAIFEIPSLHRLTNCPFSANSRWPDPLPANY